MTETVKVRVFPNRIRKYRKEQHMTQKELADKIFVVPQLVSKFEKGQAPIKLDYCIAICLALGTTLDEMFWDGNKIVEKEVEM